MGAVASQEAGEENHLTAMCDLAAELRTCVADTRRLLNLKAAVAAHLERGSGYYG